MSAATQPVLRTQGGWRARTWLILRTLVRYLLAAGMAPYAVSKLLNFQFQVPGWEYTRPLGEISGKYLTWAFLGYQPWFQFLLGALEGVPALLLLFRKTQRIGALLMFPVLLNVVLMNFALDLWDETKRISLVLLAMNVFLLACDLPFYWSFLRDLLQRPETRPGRRRLVGNVAEAVLPAALVVAVWYGLFAPFVYTMPSDFIGRRQINGAGTWAVESARVGGTEMASPETRMYFDFMGGCRWVGVSGTIACKFKADPSKHTFEITGPALDGDPGTISGRYVAQGDELRLTGERSHQPVEIRLRRFHWGKQLPLRGAVAPGR